VREMRDERKKEKKCTNHVREKGETKLVSEMVSEYYSSKLVSKILTKTFWLKW
jgi:hypothetical protein